MRDKRMFIQFIHPGGEHSPDSGRTKHWNDKLHRRKFMTASGSISDGVGVQEAEVMFWGEWEAESRVVRTFRDARGAEPHFLFEPYYRPRSSYLGLQNTDPFVFGGFHYTGCQQRTVKGPTQMRYLRDGSIILFGSCLRKSEFMLDTVFVVAGHVDHCKDDFDQTVAPRISQEYRDVTFGPWYDNEVDEQRDWRLYSGATIDSPYSGMYSFFPALPMESDGNGFSRPIINLPGYMTPHLLQGRKTTEVGEELANDLWQSVVDQVLQQDLMLGVRAELPKEERS